MTERKKGNIALGIVIILFIIYKWSALVLPYFWDEAWSYIPAISQMALSGPCLWPGCIDVELYRGHPMFFYFIGAVWMKISGGSLMAMHLLAMGVSVLSVLSLYRLANRYIRPVWALFVAIILLLQEVFLVQASFVLPEILLMLLMTESVYHYVSGNKKYFILFASLLCLTKETGLVILLSIVVFHFWQKKRISKESLWLIAPFIPAATFYIYQKIKFGWLFFPLHVSLTDFSLPTLMRNSKLVFNFLFLEQGRQYLLIAILVLIVWRIVEEKRDDQWFLKAFTRLGIVALIIITPPFGVAFGVYFISRKYWLIVQRSEKNEELVKLFALMFVLLVVFSTANFLMLRYLVIFLPLLILPAVMLIESLASKNKLKTVYIIIAACGVFIGSMYVNYNTRGWHDDVSLNYTNVVKVHRDLIAHCEGKSWHQQKIHTQFLLHQNMSHPALGYLRVSPFEAVNYSSHHPEDFEIVIFSNVELDESRYDAIKSNPNYHLDKRFEYHKAWGEIYISH